MRSRAPIICVLCAFAGLMAAAPARAWTYGDTLTTIWRPLPNLPVITRPGDTFTVWANAGAGAGGWSASLKFGALTVPLAAAGGGYQPTKARWELGFTVPAGTPEEIYDLELTSSSTLPDISAHAVKVIPEYRTSYYFAQVSDTHLPSHPFSSDGNFNTADTSGIVDFSAVIADLNLIHPEFVLLTGDFVNEGELEEYLGMYEMGRAKDVLSRLFPPIFVSSGNHDIGGWQPTPPPAGTARKNWWRHFGWPFLGNPPSGDPNHSQNFSFDYGLLHVIGLESYLNNGSYDGYQTAIWGAKSMTTEQMNWLAADVAAVPAGHKKLAFYHYDFGGPGSSQFGNPAALGLDGVIWGHNHGVAEGNRTAQPFNLGLQAVIDGRRTFRIFRVNNGAMSPGIMHHSGTSTDSLTTTWDGPNNGTQGRLTATVLNRFGEAWERAQLLFVLADHDSSVAATGGTIAQTIRHGGRLNVYVNCTLNAGATTVVSVAPVAPNPVGVEPAPFATALRFDPPAPSPFQPGAGTLALRFALPRSGWVTVTVLDITGRRVARVFEGAREAGTSTVAWDGRGDLGRTLPAGVYLALLETGQGRDMRRFVLVR